MASTAPPACVAPTTSSTGTSRRTSLSRPSTPPPPATLQADAASFRGMGKTVDSPNPFSRLSPQRRGMVQQTEFSVAGRSSTVFLPPAPLEHRLPPPGPSILAYDPAAAASAPHHKGGRRHSTESPSARTSLLPSESATGCEHRGRRRVSPVARVALATESPSDLFPTHPRPVKRGCNSPHRDRESILFPRHSGADDAAPPHRAVVSAGASVSSPQHPASSSTSSGAQPPPPAHAGATRTSDADVRNRYKTWKDVTHMVRYQHSHLRGKETVEEDYRPIVRPAPVRVSHYPSLLDTDLRPLPPPAASSAGTAPHRVVPPWGTY